MANTYAQSGAGSATDQYNAVRYADPGEVQTKIDEVNALDGIGRGREEGTGIVKLDATATYDPGAELDIKPGVRLQGPALFDISGDHDVVFLDNGSQLMDIVFTKTKTESFSSSWVRLDTGESTAGPYGYNDAVQARFSVFGAGSEDTGTGLLFDCQASGAGNDSVTVGSRFDIFTEEVDTGIEASLNTADSFVNNVAINYVGRDSNTFISHTGTQSGQPFNSEIHANIQFGNETGAVLYDNPNGGTPATINGIVQDVDTGESQLLATNGPCKMELWDVTTVNGAVEDLGDGSSGQGAELKGVESWGLIDLEDGQRFDITHGPSRFDVELDGARKMTFNPPDGVFFLNGAAVRFQSPTFLQNTYSDDTNASNSELYYDTTDQQVEFKDSGGTIHNLG